jgi:hypothetical protein
MYPNALTQIYERDGHKLEFVLCCCKTLFRSAAKMDVREKNLKTNFYYYFNIILNK